MFFEESDRIFAFLRFTFGKKVFRYNFYKKPSRRNMKESLSKVADVIYTINGMVYNWRYL